MTIDELVKSIAVQFPAIAVLLVFTVTLYRDMRNDAKSASEQREESLSALRSLKEEIGKLTDAVTRSK